MPFDILAGTDKIRMGIEQGKELAVMEADWTIECDNFDQNVRQKFLIYD